MLEQVPVIAGDLEDAALGAERQPLRHLFDVAPGVLDPAVRIRRKVGVFREDVVGRYIFVELYEETPLAQESVQRIERLHVIEGVCWNETLAERRHPQVHERPGQCGRAEPARPAFRGRGPAGCTCRRFTSSLCQRAHSVEFLAEDGSVPSEQGYGHTAHSGDRRAISDLCRSTAITPIERQWEV